MTQTANTNSIGAGQQTPFDSTSDAAQTMFIARQLIAQLEMMIPVRVTAVHPGSGSPPLAGQVDVQILVSLLDGAGNQVKQGIVYGVPYFRVQGGPWAIICDPAVGDVGIIISASRDISNLTNGVTQQQMPGSNRQVSYSDGIYLGGVFNSAAAATLWLKSDGTWTLTDRPGNVLQGDATGITATPSGGGFFSVNGSVRATGAIIAGFGTADQVGVQSHTHPANGSPPTPGT